MIQHFPKKTMRIRGRIVLACALSCVALVALPSRGRADVPASQQSVLFLPLVTRACVQTFSFIPPDNSANEQAIADGINAQRADNGLPALLLVPQLIQSTRWHSRDMADHNFTSHIGSDGSNPDQRMVDACYMWGAGENTGWGFGGDTNRMVNWWMNSPSHRAAILNAGFKEFGVGYAFNANSNWKHYWTVNFGYGASAIAGTSLETIDLNVDRP